MTEHKIRVIRYQIQDMLNHMTARAYTYGVTISDGEAFGELMENVLELIDERLNINVHPPSKSE